jgi:hypothetical protein
VELHNVRASLLNILELVERDPGIEAASDDLYAVTKELAGGADRGPRLSRLLQKPSCASPTGLHRQGRASKRASLGSAEA